MDVNTLETMARTVGQQYGGALGKFEDSWALVWRHLIRPEERPEALQRLYRAWRQGPDPDALVTEAADAGRGFARLHGHGFGWPQRWRLYWRDQVAALPEGEREPTARAMFAAWWKASGATGHGIHNPIALPLFPEENDFFGRSVATGVVETI